MWQGGKPIGSLNKRKDTECFVVRFLNPTLTKGFYYKRSGNKEEEYEKAIKFRYEESERRSKTRNKYRYITDENGEEYIEVKLYHQDGEQIMICDNGDLDLVEKYTWYAYKDKKTYYVKH